MNVKVGNSVPTDKKIGFFGVDFDLVTMDETISDIVRAIDNREFAQFISVNVAILVMSQTDAKLRDAIRSCRFITADGVGIIWAAKALGISIPERLPAIDVMFKLVDVAKKKKYRLYLLGAEEAVVSAVAEKYRKTEPELQIMGYHHGYFKEGSGDEAKIVAEITGLKVDILCMATPSPKKELFLNKYQKAMGVPFAIGVGGTFDIIAGKIKRAPLWMQKYGFEWIYRLMQEPGRLWKRYLFTNTKFLGMFLKKFFCR